MMRSRPDGWVQAYNVGAVVDDTAQVIVATGVTADPVDTRSLPGLVEQVTRNTGRSPHRLLADAGYCSDDNLAHLGGAGIEASSAEQSFAGAEYPASGFWSKLNASNMSLAKASRPFPLPRCGSLKLRSA